MKKQSSSVKVARKSKPVSAKNPVGLEAHPYAEILPPMAEAEYQALKSDIASNGLREPIILFEGKILDGRHRHRACQELQIRPQFMNLSGNDPLAYIYSKALHRNMTDTQKACAAVRIEAELSKEGYAIREANLKQNGPEKVPVPLRRTDGKSRDFAGALFGVSGRYVSEAKLLFTSAPKLFEECFTGRQFLTRAVREYRRTTKHEQLKASAVTARQILKTDDIEIRTGDCLDLAPAVMRQSARLIFCDPQYNIGYDYGKKRIDDELSAAEYLKFTETWMQEAHRILSLDGSLWVLICDEWAGEYAVLLKKLGFTIRNWIKWFESFGNNCANKFNRTSRHLFYCVKDPDHFVFNDFAVRRPSDRFAKYGDKRAVSGGKIWDDVWGINPPIPRLVDNAAERVPEFPTQLPLALVEPIVRVASDPYDQVMDFFSGSGTTAVACLRSHRKFLGFEKDKDFAARSRQRLAVIAGSKE